MNLQMSIDSSHQPLGSRLFISGGSIYLPGEIKILYRFKFKCRFKLDRIEIIIFDCIGRTVNPGVFKTFNSMKGIQLYIQRKRRRKTLKIILIGRPSFRLEKKLM